MVELKDLPWIDAQKLKPVLLGFVIPFIVGATIYWFFGIIDKPEYVGTEYGYVTGCTQALSKRGHRGAIFCGAKLENGSSATFESGSYLTVNQRLVFRHYKGIITRRNSYII